MSLFVWTCLGEGAPGLSAGEPREPSTSCLARVCTGGSLPWLCIDVSVGSTAWRACSTASQNARALVSKGGVWVCESVWAAAGWLSSSWVASASCWSVISWSRFSPLGRTRSRSASMSVWSWSATRMCGQVPRTGRSGPNACRSRWIMPRLSIVPRTCCARSSRCTSLLLWFRDWNLVSWSSTSFQCWASLYVLTSLNNKLQIAPLVGGVHALTLKLGCSAAQAPKP